MYTIYCKYNYPLYTTSDEIWIQRSHCSGAHNSDIKPAPTVQ